MKLVKATEKDSDKLIEFYRTSPVTGNMHLELQKNISFFEQYKLQSDDWVTYMLVDENKNDEIQAMATIIFRPAWIEGKKQTVAYATDLRVSTNRKVILQWTKFLLPMLQKERATRNCKYVFSVVNEGQSQAYNAFIRPRTLRREIPRYYLFRKFEIVSLHGQIPFAPAPLANIETRFAKEEDLDRIAIYIAKKMQGKTLSYNHTPAVFIENFRRWKDLKIDDFLLAVDKANNIVGCTALWNSSKIEHFVPVKYDSKTMTLKEGLSFLALLGITRRLSPLNSKLNFSYLSYLQADNHDIFYSLLYKAYRSVSSNQFIVYPHFEGSLLTQPPRSFISSQIKSGLYLISSPEDPVPEFLKPRVLYDAPDFDLAFL